MVLCATKLFDLTKEALHASTMGPARLFEVAIKPKIRLWLRWHVCVFPMMIH
jgi:hypothetical protein